MRRVQPTSEPEVYVRDVRGLKALRRRVWVSGLLGIVAAGLFASAWAAEKADAVSGRNGVAHGLFAVAFGACALSVLCLPVSVLSFNKLSRIRSGADKAGMALSLLFGLAAAGILAFFIYGMTAA